MKKKKPETEKIVGKLLSVTILCPNLNASVVVNDYYISASESECDLCGSHGSVELEVSKCECGERHSIEIRSW